MSNAAKQYNEQVKLTENKSKQYHFQVVDLYHFSYLGCAFAHQTCFICLFG